MHSTFESSLGIIEFLLYQYWSTQIEEMFWYNYAFEASSSTDTLIFSPVNDNSQAIAEDQNGNRWDIFGKGLSDENQGQQLTPVRPAFMAYWFSIPAFYENTEIR